MNKNSQIYNHLSKSVVNLADTIGGSRYSTYLYTVQARADGLDANVSITPQTTVLISRVFASPRGNLEQSKFDYTFVTDITGEEFDNLNFKLNKSQEFLLAQYLIKLTDCINTQNNWRFIPNYSRLLDLMDKHHYSDLIRNCNSIYDKNKDMNKIINTIVQSIGINKAKELINKSYTLTPLANLLYTSIKELKLHLDENNLSHEDMSKINYYHKGKQIEQGLKKAQINK